MVATEVPTNIIFNLLCKKIGPVKAWLVLILIPSIITSGITYFFSDHNSKKREKAIYNQLITQINNTNQIVSSHSSEINSLSENVNQVNSKIEFNIGTENNERKAVQSTEYIKGKTTEFNESEWIVTNMPIIDGYYCNTGLSGYNIWSIWSKEKYNLNSNFSLRLSIQASKSTELNPIVSWAYGEYTNTSQGPKTQYRISFFERDEKNNLWVRLYPSESNTSVAQQKLLSIPNFNSDMEFIITNSIIAENSNKIAIGGTIKYLESETLKETHFNLDDDFSTRLETIGLAGVTKQVGIGINRNFCIKPITFEKF